MSDDGSLTKIFDQIVEENPTVEIPTIDLFKEPPKGPPLPILKPKRCQFPSLESGYIYTKFDGNIYKSKRGSSYFHLIKKLGDQ